MRPYFLFIFLAHILCLSFISMNNDNHIQLNNTNNAMFILSKESILLKTQCFQSTGNSYSALEVSITNKGNTDTKIYIYLLLHRPTCQITYQGKDVLISKVWNINLMTKKIWRRRSAAFLVWRIVSVIPTTNFTPSDITLQDIDKNRRYYLTWCALLDL